MIDEKLARRYWPNEDPLGKQVQSASGGDSLRIVGIVAHVMQSNLASDVDSGVMYLSILQDPIPIGSIVVKTTGDAAALAGVIRDAVRETDASLPLFNIKPMDAMVGNSLAPRLFLLRVLGFFAGAALFLAALGLYGVISYSVAQRTREIGIRIALGAERRSVLKLVVGQGFRLAATGVAVGICCRRFDRTVSRKPVVPGQRVRSVDDCRNGCGLAGCGTARQLFAGPKSGARRSGSDLAIR